MGVALTSATACSVSDSALSNPEPEPVEAVVETATNGAGSQDDTETSGSVDVDQEEHTLTDSMDEPDTGDSHEPEVDKRVIIPNAAPVPPGAALDISASMPVPGESFNFNVCTAAYSFSLEDGRNIAVTASHCARVGDTVWAGSDDGNFTFPAEPIGKVIYSDLYDDHTHKLDVSFIELNDNANWVTYHTDGELNTAIADNIGALPEHVCKLGRSTGKTCGEVTHSSQVGTLHATEGELQSSAARAKVCGRSGDSGGPVFGNVDGHTVIVGLVSGTTTKLEEAQTCSDAEEMEMSFTAVVDVQRLVREVLGTPAASYT